MKRSTTDQFLVDDIQLLMPDADISITKEDLEGDSGRDESGVYHRCVVRSSIQKWSFSYRILTAEEYRYLEGLFAGKNVFEFSYPGLDGSIKTTNAYKKSTSVTYFSQTQGLYKNLSFDIIEC